MADELGWGPIHEAVRSGKVAAVQTILASGIDINKMTRTGVSPLNIAIEQHGKDHPMSKFLLGQGAVNINEKGEL